MLLYVVGIQLITILWAIYHYVYHLGYDNLNTFVNDSAEWTLCSADELSGPLYMLFELRQIFTVNCFFSFVIQGQLFFFSLTSST